MASCCGVVGSLAPANVRSGLFLVSFCLQRSVRRFFCTFCSHSDAASAALLIISTTIDDSLEDTFGLEDAFGTSALFLTWATTLWVAVLAVRNILYVPLSPQPLMWI